MRFPEIAAALAERGVSSLRFDFTGNGDSGGDFCYANSFGEVGESPCITPQTPLAPRRTLRPGRPHLVPSNNRSVSLALPVCKHSTDTEQSGAASTHPKVREPARCRADRQTADRRAGAGAGRGHTRGGALGARRAAARGHRAARAQQGRPRGHAVRVLLRRRPARARPGGQLRPSERPAGAVWRRRHAGHGGADGPRRGGLALRQSARAAAHLLPHQGGARRLALVALGRTCAMPCCCKVWRARGSSVACAPCMCACRQGCRRAAQRGRLGGACVAEGLAGCCREGFARTPCW